MIFVVNDVWKKVFLQDINFPKWRTPEIVLVHKNFPEHLNTFCAKG